MYKLARGHDCDAPGREAADTATCILMTHDTGEDADLTIAIDQPTLTEQTRARNGLTQWRSIASVTAALRRDGTTIEVLRQTEAVISSPSIPAFWAPAFEGMHTHGVETQLVARRLIQFP